MTKTGFYTTIIAFLMTIAKVNVYALPLDDKFLSKNTVMDSATLAVFYQASAKKHKDFLEKLEQRIKADGRPITLKKIDVNQYLTNQLERSWKKIQQDDKTILAIISIGKVATEKTLSLRHSMNQWCIYVNKTDLDKLHQIYKQLNVNVSGIYEEQSFSRQLLLAKNLKPELTDVSLLFKQDDKLNIPGFQSLAKQQNLSLNYSILNLTDTAESYFKKLIKPYDVFIVSNNTHLYSDNHLKTLVVAAHKHRVILIGCRFEDATLGALTAVYTPTEALIKETLLEINNLMSGNEMSSPKFSTLFKVKLNQQAVINLQDSGLKKTTLNEEELTQLIYKMETKNKSLL